MGLATPRRRLQCSQLHVLVLVALLATARFSCVGAQTQEFEMSETIAHEGFDSLRSHVISEDGNVMLVVTPNVVTCIRSVAIWGCVQRHYERARAFVYRRFGTAWLHQTDFLPPSTKYNFENEAIAIASDGSLLVIGAPYDQNFMDYRGCVLVYARSGSLYTLQATITKPNDASGDRFGHALALSRTAAYLAVGAPKDDATSRDQGSVTIFVRSGATWTVQATLLSHTGGTETYFGVDLAISPDGYYLAVTGTEQYSTKNVVYIYVRSGASWFLQTTLSDCCEQFGYPLAMAAGGAYLATYRQASGGQAVVLARSGASWTYQAKLQGANELRLGYDAEIVLSAEGNILMVVPSSEESVIMFTRSGSTWLEAVKLVPKHTGNVLYFGRSMTLSPQTGVISISASVDSRGTGDFVGTIFTAVVCFPGQFMSSSGVCLSCASGKYSTALSAPSCTNCPAGTYNGASGSNSIASCWKCPAGRYSEEEGATSPSACLLCQSGTYASEQGTAECSPCEAGKFVNAEGATTCTSCQPGEFSSQGATACTKCQRGSYNPSPGAAECDLCPSGSYGPDEGLTSSSMCLLCEIGTFNPTAGANSSAACVLCEMGSYNPSGGATECEMCPTGTYSTEEGAVAVDTCIPCEPGTFGPNVGAHACLPCDSGAYCPKFGADASTACNDGTFSSAMGAVNSSTCRACPAGTTSGQNVGGTSECAACAAGTYSNFEGSPNCHDCETGKYSDSMGSTSCSSCPAGMISVAGSTSRADCQNITISFAVAFAVLVAAGACASVYLWFGGISDAVQSIRQTVMLPTARVCMDVANSLLQHMRREKKKDILWKIFLVLMLAIVLFLIGLAVFIANVFLVSRSFFIPNDWLEAFRDIVIEVAQLFPPLSFMTVFLPAVDFLASIDLGALLYDVRVSCEGSQAPAVLFLDVIVIVATVLLIESHFPVMLALAFSPTSELLRDKLTFARAPTICSRASNLLQLLILATLSILLMSSSRYLMQFLATLIQYRPFLRGHSFSAACNEDGIDQLLAGTSTFMFFLFAIPALFLMIRVLMPGLLARNKRVVEFLDTHINEKQQQHQTTKRAWLHLFNPLCWLASFVRWLMLWQQRLLERDTLNRTQLHQRRAQGRIAERPADVAPFDREFSRNTPQLSLLLTGLFTGKVAFCDIISICLKKITLALQLAFGIWTDDTVASLQVDGVARDYFGWTQDHTAFHEDVMAVLAPMHGMVWLLVPVTLILTKLAEATNQPPVFVFTNKVRMFSPLLFRSWAEAEAATVQGVELLRRIQVHKATETEEQPVSCWRRWKGWFADRLEHNARVLLVWVLGARLPTFLVNIALLGLAVYITITPSLLMLEVALGILLLWALIKALASALDVTALLSMRKQRPKALDSTSVNTQQPEGIELQLSTRSPKCAARPGA